MKKISIRRKKRVTHRPGGSARVAAGPEAGELLGDYLTGGSDDRREVKWAGIAAILVHFALLVAVFPSLAPEPVRITERNAATVIKRYRPPSPPAKARKTTRKKKTDPIPIPDPTPNEPEPIVVEASDVDFGELSTEFVVGLPEAPPGPPGARVGAFGIGGGGIVPPVLVERVLPDYTADATRRGVQGGVYIEAVVTVEGSVVEPRLLRGLPDDELNDRALAAVQQWRFRPGLKDGEPVPVIATFEVTFTIH